MTSSGPQLPSHESLSENVTTEDNPTQKKPTQYGTKHTSWPTFRSKFFRLFSSYSSDSSDDDYYKWRRCEKRNKNKNWSKMRFHNPIKSCSKLTAKLPIATYKSKVIKLKLDKDTLQRRVYLLFFFTSSSFIIIVIWWVRWIWGKIIWRTWIWMWVSWYVWYRIGWFFFV